MLNFNRNTAKPNKVIDTLVVMTIMAYVTMITFVSFCSVLLPRVNILLSEIVPEHYYTFPVRFIITIFHLRISLALCLN